MKLILIDNDYNAYLALKNAFAQFDEIDVIHDDIFDRARNTIVAPANSTGHMDPGINQRYFDFFGISIYNTFIDKLNTLALSGTNTVAVIIETKHKRIPYLIITPVMQIPKFVDPENCCFAMGVIIEEIDKNSDIISEVYCPGLFTGVPNIDYSEAARQMALAYRNRKK